MPSSTRGNCERRPRHWRLHQLRATTSTGLRSRCKREQSPISRFGKTPLGGCGRRLNGSWYEDPTPQLGSGKNSPGVSLCGATSSPFRVAKEIAQAIQKRTSVPCTTSTPKVTPKSRRVAKTISGDLNELEGSAADREREEKPSRRFGCGAQLLCRGGLSIVSVSCGWCQAETRYSAWCSLCVRPSCFLGRTPEKLGYGVARRDLISPQQKELDLWTS